MEEDLKLFDMDWRGFVEKVLERGGYLVWEFPEEITFTRVRGVLISLAYMLWLLGQRVKKLEEEE